LSLKGFNDATVVQMHITIDTITILHFGFLFIFGHTICIMVFFYFFHGLFSLLKRADYIAKILFRILSTIVNIALLTLMLARDDDQSVILKHLNPYNARCIYSCKYTETLDQDTIYNHSISHIIKI
jgi:hypothetical protein